MLEKRRKCIKGENPSWDETQITNLAVIEISEIEKYKSVNSQLFISGAVPIPKIYYIGNSYSAQQMYEYMLGYKDMKYTTREIHRTNLNINDIVISNEDVVTMACLTGDQFLYLIECQRLYGPFQEFQVENDWPLVL
ncbi:hypothetical protein ACTA71_002738 [Dictyostelium dimigraforme]